MATSFVVLAEKRMRAQGCHHSTGISPRSPPAALCASGALCTNIHSIEFNTTTVSTVFYI
jgi:hypothetical protein